MSTATPAAAGREGSGTVIGEARSAAGEVANSDWGDRGARVGIAARGIVFLVLAYLVARIALGALGGGGTKKSASGEGVADAIAEQPGGNVALVLLGIGLLLYALFSLLEIFRTYESSEVKRWGERARSLWQAGLYGGFGVYCFVKVVSAKSGGGSSSESSQKQEQWSARVLRWPAGWLWLGLLGVVLLVIAGFQVYRCIKRSFMDDLKEARMTRGMRRFAEVVGIAGHAGRGGAFALVGWFVLHAAFENDPEKGKGVDGSARMLANSAGGPYLLWLLAVGLAAFGVYQFVEARYRRV